MSSRNVDRNLLFGLLALQNNFVSREDLIAAVSAWLIDKSRELAEILRERRALADDEFRLIAALAAKHLARHDHDPEKSLAALSSLGSVRADLEQLGDPEIEASLSHLSVAGSEAGPQFAKTLPPDQADKNSSRFRILRPHAEGGLGRVFVAEDLELNREVALKEIKIDSADDPTSRSRFVLEAEVTGNLEHPGIVPVYGLGQYADGRPFYAMRFIKGDSLKEAVKRFHARVTSPADYDSVEFRVLLGRFIDVCQAIAYAHSRRVLHRDLKPGNIMLGKYGETLVVDWGLAKVLGHDSSHEASDEHSFHPKSGSGSEATIRGRGFGTPGFMSPEQAEGRIDELGPASDVYSLGATLYYVLAGQPPYTGEDIGEVLKKLQDGEPPQPPQAVKPGVSSPLSAICQKAMSHRQGDRYGSPKALLQDIQRYLADEPIEAQAEPLKLRAGRWLRKHPRSIAALAATLLVGVVSATVVAVVVGLASLKITETNEKLIMADAQREAALIEERKATNQAQLRHREVEQARTEEERARRLAETVTDYMVQAFESPDPHRDGRTITVAEVLKQARERLEGEFADDPLTKAALLVAIGRTYTGLALANDAVPLQEEALRLRSKALGDDHPQAIDALSQLAAARLGAGQIQEAIPLFERCLIERELTLPGDDLQVLKSKANLGIAHLYNNDPQRAEPLLSQAWNGQRDQLGDDHRDTLVSMSSLATSYKRMGELGEALPLFERCLALRKQSLGETHPETVTSLNNLGEACRISGDLDKALEYLEASLSSERHRQDEIKQLIERLRQPHPNALMPFNNLANVYTAIERYADAIPLYNDCCELSRVTKGEDHPQTLALLNSLAAVCRAAGELEQAAAHYQRLFELRQRNLRDHWQTFEIQVGFGRVLREQKKFTEAQTNLIAGYKGLLARQAAIPAPEQKRIASAVQELIRLYTDWDQPDEAAKWQKIFDEHTATVAKSA
jgi:serine/threonine protein kinase/tetratricopeptide (TPR) repeat protein